LAASYGLSFDERSFDTGLIVNDNKVSDHHALIPTRHGIGISKGTLPVAQKTVFDLVSWRLLCATGQPHKYLATKVYLDIEGEAFTATGRQTLEAGFTELGAVFMKGVMPESDGDEAEQTLPETAEGEVFQPVAVSCKKAHTKPLKPYTEDTLLLALEHAGRDMEKELKDAIKDCGLGTPATRAATIEKIIEHGFVERKGGKKTKTLHPTKLAQILMELLPDAIKSAEMTARWESKLANIQYGALGEDAFLEDISEYVGTIVKTSKMFPPESNPFSEFIDARREVIGKCPRCGSNVYEGGKNFYCSNKEKDGDGKYQCEFTMWKDDKFFVLKGKMLTTGIAKDLLANGHTELKGCTPKDATKDLIVFLKDTGKYVNYRWEFPLA
jgi:DNA topoisomerase-3